tara:strand:+ start:1925 stop:2323 length:399 start_codon:yes stop_codon:yes gene_type:complete
MAKDGFVEITSGHLAGTERRRHVPVQPSLSDAQRAKYRDILGERDGYLFQLKDDTLTINLPISRTQGRYFTFWYVQDALPEDAPYCSDAGAREPNCGICAEPLGETWYMAWSWNPEDEREFDETCSHLRDDN